MNDKQFTITEPDLRAVLKVVEEGISLKVEYNHDPLVMAKQAYTKQKDTLLAVQRFLNRFVY